MIRDDQATRPKSIQASEAEMYPEQPNHGRQNNLHSPIEKQPTTDPEPRTVSKKYRDPISAGPDCLPQADKIAEPEYQHVKPHQTSNENIAKKVSEIWMQRMVAAKARWGRLSENELIQSGGQRQRLTDLVRQSYSISQADAEMQVINFLSKNETSFTLPI